MVIYLIMLIALVLVGAFYFYHFIKRTFRILLRKEVKGWRKVILGVICFIASVPAINMFTFYAILYYHLLVISVVLELVNLLLKKRPRFTRLYYSGLISISITAIIMAYGLYNINHVQETDLTINSDKIGSTKIVQITDLHMGNTIGISKLESICNEISQVQADIITLTGDIFDESTSLEQMKEACRLLGGIANTKGIYYVFGNHDASTYASSPVFREEDIRQEFAKYGVITLEDEAAVVGDITIIGRADASFLGTKNRKSTAELMKNVDSSQFVLLLDHQPLDLKKNEEAGVDLQVSGHTHGGQIWPAGLVEHLVSGTLVYGEYRSNGFTAFTSSGIAGWGYAIKTGAKSEYVVITIE